MNFSYQIDQKSLNQIRASLVQYERKIRNKVIRSGFKEWAKATTEVAKGNVTWNDKLLRRYITSKIKILKKKRGVWVGVGVRSGIKKPGVDEVWLGTKSRWYNDGWTSYPKGRKSGKKGKGWRRGLRGVGGRKIYQTEYLTKTAKMMLPRVPQYILNSINAVNKGQT
jgi:hypothetical protein